MAFKKGYLTKPGRSVDLRDPMGGGMVREMPKVAYNVDMDRITGRLKREFEPAFSRAVLHTDMFAEMIAAGVLLVLEELASQGERAGNTAILIPGPPDGD